MASILFHDPRLASIAGGGETVTLQLIALLLKAEHEVTILTRKGSHTPLFENAISRNPGLRIEELVVNEVPVDDYDAQTRALWHSDRLAPESLAFNAAAQAFYKSRSFDLVVVSFILDLAGLLTRDPILFNVFGLPPNRDIARLERPLLNRCSHITFASHYAKREFLKLFELSDRESLGPVVHSSIHPDFFGPRVACGREFDVCFAGRLVRRKGMHVVLDALAHLRVSLGLRLRLAVAGDGPEREALRGQAHAIGVENQVAWQGVLDTRGLVDLLDHSQLFVYPTVSCEVFGCSNLEAMARGLCVVTTNLGGTGDYVNPGVNAVVCEPGSASGLADALAAVIKDDAMRTGISTQALCDAQNFRPEVKRSEWLKVFAEAVSQRPCV